MSSKPTNPETAAKQPEDVPDTELEAVAGGHGHERWYHHDYEGRRGYYREGRFVRLEEF